MKKCNFMVAFMEGTKFPLKKILPRAKFMKKETTFALTTFTPFFILRLFRDVFLVQVVTQHVKCVTILGMYFTENLLGLH